MVTGMETKVPAKKNFYIFLCLTFLVASSVFLYYTLVKEQSHPYHHPRLIHTRHETIDTRAAPSVLAPPGGMMNTLKKLSMSALSFAIAAPSSSVSRVLNVDNNEKTTFYFHFDHQMKDHDAALEQLKSIGIKLGHYIPHNTYIVTATAKQAYEAKEKVAGLVWVGEMEPHHKMPRKDLLQGHVEKHVELAEFRDFEASRTCHKDSKDLAAGKRKLLSTEEKQDVEFIIHAQTAVHESKEELKKEVMEWEEQMKKEIPDVKFASLVVASKKKIAVGVLGHTSALKVVEWLGKKGLVHWVEIKPPAITHNKYASMVAQSFEHPDQKPIWTMGITGAGQNVGVGDTGVDSYHCFFYDENNPVPYQRNQRQDVAKPTHRKFSGFWEFMDKYDSEGGHGSHVAGTAAGNAIPTQAHQIVKDYSSLAKDAKLAFLDAGCDTTAGCTCPDDTQCECDLKANRLCPRKFGVVYLPLDLSDGYFPWFYSVGAKVASNSWGTGYYKDFSFGYSTSTAEIDQFSWDHKDFLPVFAAGNSGGQFGYASLTSESEAKNALVIGATQSSLESFQALANFTDYSRVVERIKAELYQTYCLEAPDSEQCQKAKAFTAADCCNDGGKCSPVSSKCCGNQDFDQFPTIGFRCCAACIDFEMAHQPEHFTPNNLALFTARGPTMDGRIKPDIVTTGDKVLSTKSQGTKEERKCSSSQNPNDLLLKHEGTSMACPVAASAAVLVRQYFEDGYYPSGQANPANVIKPSASLVKGMLIHSAQVLTGYIYLMSKHIWWPLQYQQGHRFQLRQAYMQGFGRIDLSKALAKEINVKIPNPMDRQISTGEIHSYCFYVNSGSKPFKASLVWTDFPSSPVAKINLVNDLDLILVSPDKKIYYGNGVKSAIGSSRDEPDYLNNVEQIFIGDVPPGHYNVIVRGTAVPKGPQLYTILISGDIVEANKCNSIPAAITAEVQKYMNLSIAFGVLSIIGLPALSILTLYFYLQYKRVTTGPRGYIDSAMAKGEGGQYFSVQSEEELGSVKVSAPATQPAPEMQQN